MYTKFLTYADREITIDRVLQIIQLFQTNDLPKLKKLKDYYDGKQAIMFREATDDGRPCSKVVVNYCRTVTSTFEGALCSKPICFVSDEDNADDAIGDILNYNDINTMNSEYLRQALIYGRAFQIMYVLNGQQRIQIFDSRECIPVYDDTIEQNLKYVIRFFQSNAAGDSDVESLYKIELYTDSGENIYFDSTPGFNTAVETGRVPNFYDQCPVTVFSLNTDETGIFEPILSLQDSVNETLSLNLDALSDWSDAYLVLQGMSADEETLKDMKKHRCILLDGDEHCNAEFLTKNASDTQSKDLLETLNTKIWTICQCPDFSDPQTFGNASSGVALRYKLLSFQQALGNIENQMRKALQRMIELMSSLINSINGEEVWRDIEIVFNENFPVQYDDITKLVNALRGIVSMQTMLSWIPGIDDPVEEMKRLEQERKQNADLYYFDNQQQFSDDNIDDGEEE